MDSDLVISGPTLRGHHKGLTTIHGMPHCFPPLFEKDALYEVRARGWVQCHHLRRACSAPRGSAAVGPL